MKFIINRQRTINNRQKSRGFRDSLRIIIKNGRVYYFISQLLFRPQQIDSFCVVITNRDRWDRKNQLCYSIHSSRGEYWKREFKINFLNVMEAGGRPLDFLEICAVAWVKSENPIWIFNLLGISMWIFHFFGISK